MVPKVKKSGKVSSKKVVQEERSREPDFMVQVSDPVTLRRDLLESLREIIIFMQGYEKFRKIQEEKVATFGRLKEDIKDLNTLIDGRLRRYVPKGKLRGLNPAEKKEELQQRQVQVVDVKPTKKSPVVNAAPTVSFTQKAPSELEELESQLKDIEQQLQGM